MPSWEEQKLCIGASFVLAATNGHDPTRRINMEGFCQVRVGGDEAGVCV